jgi:hypothetical protein
MGDSLILAKSNLEIVLRVRVCFSAPNDEPSKCFCELLKAVKKKNKKQITKLNKNIAFFIKRIEEPCLAEQNLKLLD